jgi:predicted N-acetyltransferase YhbS
VSPERQRPGTGDGDAELIEFGELTPADRTELEGDESDPFDAAGETLRFRPKERHVALRDDRGRLIASAGLTLSEVEVGDARFPIVGLGGVIVNAGYRGRGLARAVVDAALERARTMGPEFMVLFCHLDRVGLYRRLGFALLDEPVLVRQPHGFERITQRTMWQALQPGGRWPDGAPVIHTLPF